MDLLRTQCSYVHPRAAHHHFPERSECSRLAEGVCKNIRSGLIHESPERDTVQMSPQGRRGKQTIEGTASTR